MRRARVEIAALTVCLFGFIALILIVGALKAGISNLPRILFLASLAMVAAPLFLALSRRVSPLYLIPPAAAVFLLYPILNPHGVVYFGDPIFNFRFSQSVLEAAAWLPGQVPAPAETYSFYPLGNVFLTVVIHVAGVPGEVGYLWATPLLRFLVLPAVVYAIGRRLFDGRVAVISLLFYLGTASILFNIPVQQEIATIFFALSLLALVIMVKANTASTLFRARVLFLILAPAMVMSHHFTSYVFAAWLGLLALLSMLPLNRATMNRLHLGGMFIYYASILAVYVVTFTRDIFFEHVNLVITRIFLLIQPEGGPEQVPLGQTFSQLEIAWLVGSIAVLALIALLSMRYYWGRGEKPFVVANGVVGLGLLLGTLPLLATDVNYIPLRIGGYTSLILAPLAAAAVVRWVGTGRAAAPSLPLFLRERRWFARSLIVALIVVLFMGGSLAPVATRLYFEPEEMRRTDSPLLLGEDSLRGASWAQSHFGVVRAWGDRLAMDTFGGFGGMQVEWGSARFFRSATLDEDMWAHLEVGDYIVTNVYMTIYLPDFQQEAGPGEPLDPLFIEKFASDPRFSQVYQDATFAVFRVMQKP